MRYDIAIIGAGPAGAALASFLPKQYRILLLDRRDLLDGENQKGKCCGGLLAPDAQKMLGEMGLAVPKDVMVDPQMFLVRTIDFDNYLESYYQRFYFNMSRLKFDEWIVSSIPNNVDLALGCRFTSLIESRDGYEIAFLHNNKIFTQTVKLVIGADGAWSKVRQQVYGDNDPLKKYIAIQEWFETDKPIPYYGAVFDSEITDFYSWTIPKDGKLIIGSALSPDKDANKKFEILKSKLKEYGLVFGNCIHREGAYLIRPRRKDIITGDDHAALVGEAGGFISPSSAEGISFALKSAHALAMSLNDGIEDFQKRYRKNIKPILNSITFKQMKSPGMYNKTIRGMVIKSRILSSNRLFNQD
ncbi:MAG: FAD-binding protein [Clostridiaceae bacterium]|nr:FAD-binding protein [Clostridiaceae bacterium]